MSHGHYCFGLGQWIRAKEVYLRRYWNPAGMISWWLSNNSLLVKVGMGLFSYFIYVYWWCLWVSSLACRIICTEVYLKWLRSTGEFRLTLASSMLGWLKYLLFMNWGYDEIPGTIFLTVMVLRNQILYRSISLWYLRVSLPLYPTVFCYPNRYPIPLRACPWLWLLSLQSIGLKLELVLMPKARKTLA